MWIRIHAVALLLYAPGLWAEPPDVDRVNNRSPRFSVSEDDIRFYASYSGTVTHEPDERRIRRFGIAPKAMEMIKSARERIVASVFLFDNLLTEDEPTLDIVATLTDALVEQKQAYPGMTISVIFDPSHRAYAGRVSDAENTLRAAGIDIFYSDLLAGLKPASWLGVREAMGHVGRSADQLTFGLWGSIRDLALSVIPVPGAEFDGKPVTFETVYNAALLKANHRKVLVADDGRGGWEALVSSANPHNPSLGSANTALSVKGVPARYIYNVLREDIRHSLSLGGDEVRWGDHEPARDAETYLAEHLPPLTMPEDPGTDVPAVCVVSEKEIAPVIMEALDAAQPDDVIRIQMFYLSYQPVLDAIVRAAERVETPVRILLDANKDSFNKEKDGTPNRQVAAWLMAQRTNGVNVEIRWYATRGEQNHAKIMSITSPRDDDCFLTTGSCNWTGRNMAGVNMEMNLAVYGVPGLHPSFDDLFDRFWDNRDGVEYSLPYEAFSDHAGYMKWRLGEAPYFYSTF